MSIESRKLHTYRDKLQLLYGPEFAERRNAVSINAGLWLDKYIQNQDKKDTASRSTLIREVAALPIPEEYNRFYQQWEQTLSSYGVERQQMRLACTKGRMVIGLGEESVLETSIALQRTYGVPYIPGSALKGLAASYARQRLGDDWKKDAESKAYNTIFGDTKGVGGITFFDALLYIDPDANKCSEKVLHQDTITVHHPGYYQGKKEVPPPSDRDSPTPIPFLSATGSYLIALAAPDLENGSAWIETTFKILEHALKEMGIGAKTSSGYGRMTLEPMPMDETTRRLNEERQQCLDEEKQRVEVEKRRLDAEKSRVKNFQSEIMCLTNVAGSIPYYHKQWEQLTSDEARTTLALAIVQKVQQSGNERNMLKKVWYAELVAYLNNANQPRNDI